MIIATELKTVGDYSIFAYVYEEFHNSDGDGEIEENKVMYEVYHDTSHTLLGSFEWLENAENFLRRYKEAAEFVQQQEAILGKFESEQDRETLIRHLVRIFVYRDRGMKDKAAEMVKAMFA